MFGAVSEPAGLWLRPDRAALADTKAVQKVVKFESDLSELCCEAVTRPEAGQVVAVRAGGGMARGRVQQVTSQEVRLFLLDHGETVLRPISELLRVPGGLAAPRNQLARRLDLSSCAAPGSLRLLRELAAECGAGELSEPAAAASAGAVTGTLTVSLDPASALAHRYRDQWRGRDLARLCVNSVLAEHRPAAGSDGEDTSAAAGLPPGRLEPEGTGEAESDGSPQSDSSVEAVEVLAEAVAAVGAQRVTHRLEGRLELGVPAGEGRRAPDPLLHLPPSGRKLLPQRTVAALPWTPALLAFLQRRGLTTAKPVQELLWPGLTRLRSLLAVAGPGQGKTLGWLLPAVSQLGDTLGLLPPGPGPRLAVLCPGVEVATCVASLLQQVALETRLNLKVVQDCAGGKDLQETELINGVDVLVTTPVRLAARLAEERPVTGLGRCRQLVLEAADTLLARWPGETTGLLSCWQAAGGGQLVAVAERWSPGLEQLAAGSLAATSGPGIVLAGWLEAAVYGHLKILPSFTVTEESKAEKLVALVSGWAPGGPSAGRVLVCCRDDMAAHSLGSLLAAHRPRLLLEGATPAEVAGELGSRIRTILIITDAALALAPASPAAVPGRTALVLWDLPATNRRAFGWRLSLVRAAFRNVFDPDASTNREMDVEVHMMISAEYALHLNVIVPFLTRCGASLPEDLATYYQGVTAARERLQGLCSGLLQVRWTRVQFPPAKMSPSGEKGKEEKFTNYKLWALCHGCRILRCLPPAGLIPSIFPDGKGTNCRK